MAVAEAELGQQQRQSSVSGAPALVRRRGNLQQGQALELLGHAVEYLVDSRVFAQNAETARNNQEAVRILKGLSRKVFNECAEILPVRRRMAGWLAGLGRQRPSR